MRTFDEVIDSVMDRLGVDKELTIDLSGLNDIDKTVVEDAVEDFGYYVEDSSKTHLKVVKK